MIDDEVVRYIKSVRKKGFSDIQIITQLRKNNYPEEIINEALSRTKKTPLNLIFKYLIILCLILFIIFGLNFLLFNNNPKNIENIEVEFQEEQSFSQDLVSLSAIGISAVNVIEHNDEWVAQLQLGMSVLNYTNFKGNPVTVDGFLGPQTTYVLEQFAKKENLTPWIINNNFISRLDQRLNESFFSNYDYELLYNSSNNNIKFGYEYMNSDEIKELQVKLNSLSDESPLELNGNYNFVTATRLLQVKKVYNHNVPNNEKIKEDLSFDDDTLIALSKISTIDNLSDVEGIVWKKTSKRIVEDIKFKLASENKKWVREIEKQQKTPSNSTE